jgi:phosphoenolpyruvate carboxykinase (GTP)
VLVGASMASETTAAATDVGVAIRRDPMAMKPFCGYNFGDYWAHWLDVGAKLKHAPRIFHVNWFRQNAAGKFLWPGFGDNLRVVAWMLDRCDGRAGALETPIGYMPRPGDINTDGLDLDPATMAELCAVPPDAWRQEIAEFRKYLQGYGSRLPAGILEQLDDVERRLQTVKN